MSQTTNREAWAQSGWNMAIRQLSGGDTTNKPLEHRTMTYQHNPDILEQCRTLLARIEAQRAHGEALVDALEQAETDRDEAARAAWSAWGTRHEASTQAALQRARAHYDAALEELGQWLALVDAIDALEC